MNAVAKPVAMMVGCAIVVLSACAGHAVVVTKSGRVIEIDSRGLKFEGNWIAARTKDGETLAIHRSEVESIVGLDDPAKALWGGVDQGVLAASPPRIPPYLGTSDYRPYSAVFIHSHAPFGHHEMAEPLLRKLILPLARSASRDMQKRSP